MCSALFSPKTIVGWVTSAGPIPKYLDTAISTQMYPNVFYVSRQLQWHAYLVSMLYYLVLASVESKDDLQIPPKNDKKQSNLDKLEPSTSR